MPDVIYLRREGTDVPFGFKLQGGADFAVPLSVQQVTPNSISDLAGLRPGDAIIKINDAETSWMEHSRAKMEIIRSGNEIKLSVERNAVDPTKPQYTPLSKLRSNPPQNPANFAPPPPPPKTDLTVEKGDSILIGSSHNRAPMPFHRDVGSSIDYKATKPSNWRPGDYTQWSGNNNANNNNNNNNNSQNNQAPASNQPTVTAVFHNQYNTPIGMYSDSSVFQEFQNQTKGIMPEPTNQNFSPSTTSAFHNPSYKLPEQQAPSLPRGVDSVSMRMLNSGIGHVQGTIKQPPSVFDLKYGYNPTGASVPRGFKSVQAPTELPPEQRHAPVRKEYQVHHVKSNWVEPKSLGLLLDNNF